MKLRQRGLLYHARHSCLPFKSQRTHLQSTLLQRVQYLSTLNATDHSMEKSLCSEHDDGDQNKWSFFSNLRGSTDPNTNWNGSNKNGDNGSNEKSHAEWIREYDDIKKANHFELNIAPQCKDQLMHFKAVSARSYKWMNVLIASNHPLRFEEFMVGAFHGMDYVLRCLQDDDKRGIESCISSELLDQFEDLKWLMLDERYRFIGKMMLYLQEFDNGPNYEDMSINARYKVTYYYQLMPLQDDDDVYDQYIQKRADVIWKSVWLPSTGLKFEISEEGWIVDSVECSVVPKLN